MNSLMKQVRKNSSIYMPVPARVVSVRELTADERLFTIALPNGLSLQHTPGQFVQVSVLGVGEAPISVTSSPSRTNGSFELCVRRVGDLTAALHRLTPGDIIGVRGPFGRGFPVGKLRGKDLIFVAGGLGLAPMRSLINEVIDDRGNYGKLTIMYGTRSPEAMLFREEIKEWQKRDDLEMHVTVDTADDEWEGQVGVITTLFNDFYTNPRNTVAVVVGPPVMYKFVISELSKLKIPDGNIWLSFERKMKCGVGKCGHCQLNHIYTCQVGPSFPYAEIKQLEEAL